MRSKAEMLSQRLVIQEVTLKLQLGPRGVWLNLLSFSLVLLFNGKICCPALSHGSSWMTCLGSEAKHGQAWLSFQRESTKKYLGYG